MSQTKSIQGIAVVEGQDWKQPKKVTFESKKIEANDIVIKIEACGVCGSDIHCAAGHWGPRANPLIVGHEIIGLVESVGEGCKTLKVGQRVGVGAQALSCLECDRCKADNEPYCGKSVYTYNHPYPDGYVSQGGYASHVVVHEHFVVPIPENIPTEIAAPLLCGGVTAFSPLYKNNIGPGSKVGVIGVGGIGHMGIIFAKAMGADVTAISRRSNKKEDSLKLGASNYIATLEDEDWEIKYAGRYDFLLLCASSLTEIDVTRLVKLLKVGGKLVSICVPAAGEMLNVSPLALVGVSIGTSAIGSPAEIAALLKLVSENDLKIWVETVPISEKGVAEVFNRMESGDVRYRFTLTDFDKEFSA